MKTRSLQRINTPINSGRITSNVPPKYFGPSRTEGVKPLSDSLYKHRKRLGHYFRCGDKYMPGHRCNAKILHMIEGIDGEEDEGIGELEGMMQEEDKENNQIDEFGLSLNALTYNDTYNIIKIKWIC